MHTTLNKKNYSNQEKTVWVHSFKYNLAVACYLLIVITLPASITSGNRIVLADTPYQASDVLGQSDFDSSVGGTTAENFSGGISGVAIDETEHRLFAPDYENNRVLIFNLDNSNKLIDKTADYVLGQTDFTSSIDNTTQSTFSGPSGVAFDDAHDRLFVADGYQSNSRVMVFDLSNGITDGMDASWVLGQEDFTSDNTDTTQNGLDENGGVSFDNLNNRLFVADYFNNRVLVFDLSNGISDGMDASWVLGQEDFVSKDQLTTLDGMYNPWGVHFDTTKKRLYVADSSNSRILVFDLSNGISDGMDASWVLGQEDFVSDSPETTQNGMAFPITMTTDRSGNLLFVHDANNERVLVFDATSLTSGENAVGVIGKATFTSSGCETSRSGMCFEGYDSAMYFDNNNRSLYVSDSNNHRVLIFDFANITLGNGSNSVTIPDATFGVPYEYDIPITGYQGGVSCELTSGSLPKNVTLTSDCTITGTPASNTVYSFTVTLSDDNGIAGVFTDSQAITLTVNHARGSLADTGDNPKSIQYIALALITGSSVVLLRYFYQTKLTKILSRTRTK